MTARDPQAAVLDRLRAKGRGLAPVMAGGRIVPPKGSTKLPAQRAAAGAPVADLSRSGPITRPAPVRPAEWLTAPRDESALRMVTEFDVEIPGEWLDVRISANDRLDKRAEAKRTKLWRKAGADAAGAAWSAGPLPWARLIVRYRFPDYTRRETANLQPTSKAIVDGLVDAGLLLDDRDEYCDGPDNRRAWPNGEHAVVVQVWTPS